MSQRIFWLTKCFLGFGTGNLRENLPIEPAESFGDEYIHAQQDGPLVRSRLITPLIGAIDPVTH